MDPATESAILAALRELSCELAKIDDDSILAREDLAFRADLAGSSMWIPRMKHAVLAGNRRAYLEDLQLITTNVRAVLGGH